VAIFSLVSNMAFSTPSVNAVTLAPTTPDAACPAANKLAALTVEVTKGNGTLAEAAFCDKTVAMMPHDKVSPRQANLRASMLRPLANRVPMVPGGQPTWR